MAVLKHLASKSSNYEAVLTYLLYDHDEKNGKVGITEWKKLGVAGGLTRIEFSPLTGRTHQLRLAASCPVEKGGLGIPIVGDSLYGTCHQGQRLMLHACEITFSHPVSGQKMHITCEPDY